MKKIICFFLLSCSVSLFSQNQEVAPPTEDLVGEWTIDLRPTPDAEPYFQTFAVSSVADYSLEGTFYGSELENAILNKNWDRLYFSFTTQDQSNAYYHSGYLKDGKVYGITYCPNRSFVAPWQGEKKE